jgi:hypothetical protein
MVYFHPLQRVVGRKRTMASNQRDISFATFNLLNLQLPGKAMYAGGKVYSEEEYEAKVG